MGTSSAGRGIRVAVALAGWWWVAGVAWAQDRPREEDIFGAPEKDKEKEDKKEEKKKEAETEKPPETEKQAAPATTPSPPPSAEDARDEANLGTPARLSTEAAPENPLVIGGQFYLQARTTAQETQRLRDWTFSSPALVDAYFDARPNPRVRGFVLGRMAFDPTLAPNGSSAMVTGVGDAAGAGATMGASSLGSLLTRGTRGPSMYLDQMWLRFDIKHTVFVTAGKQHVRWGTARFWTPADFLHIRKRNPLDVFDARTGTTMLKLHLPWEERGWNFYAYGITEGTDTTSTLGSIAGAARAEVVLGTTELGIGALVQRGRKTKLAADVSTGLGEVDFYGELALRDAGEIDRVGIDPTVPLTTDPAAFAARYPVFRVSGYRAQVTGGLTYSRQYADKDVVTIGAEYFYNGLGYTDPAVYPGLFQPTLVEPATFFYLGRHYAGVFLLVPAPYSWDLTTFRLSTLGNLSDRSFTSRFDYSLLLLTHLSFEAFVQVHYGRNIGEFRLGLPERGIPPQVLDLGVALRVSL